MLGIFNKKVSFGYVPVPKVANTSMKHLMYQLEFGESFFKTKKRAVDFPSEDFLFPFTHIHDYYRKNLCDISEAKFRFVIIRDPIRRFLSAFSNRVEHHGELSEEKVQALSLGKQKKFLKPGFIYEPSLSEFIEKLNIFLNVPSMRVHMSPSMELTGALDYYTNVYRIEEISQMEADLSRITGTEIKVGKMQTGGRKIPVSELSERSLNILLDYYREEYASLGGLYKPEDVIADWKSGK